MTLSSLIRKRYTGSPATAIPATTATQQGQSAGTVAEIATVAVANPTEGRVDEASTSFRWLIRFADRDPIMVTFSPEVTHAGALAAYPNAVMAEPMLEPEISDANSGLEYDPDDRDDRIICCRCASFGCGGICSQARPGGEVSPTYGYRPAASDLPRRCRTFIERKI